jgi:hypothetical protein
MILWTNFSCPFRGNWWDEKASSGGLSKHSFPKRRARRHFLSGSNGNTFQVKVQVSANLRLCILVDTSYLMVLILKGNAGEGLLLSWNFLVLFLILTEYYYFYVFLMRIRNGSTELYRHEFYQKPEEVVVTIFAKGIPADSVTVDFGEQIVCMSIRSLSLYIFLDTRGWTSRF